MKWEIKRIEQAFDTLKKEGWDTKDELKWGFYFYGKSKEKLINIYNELKDCDYKTEILEYRKNLNLWLLYVTKEEILTIEKLHRRNLSFENLSNFFEVDSYDGWDVQKAE